MARPSVPPHQPDAHAAEVLGALLAPIGCVLADDPFPDGRTNDPARFAVRLHGRSASLHPIETGWTLPRSTLAGTRDERAAALGRAAARQLAIQRRRHDAAAALGHPGPMPLRPMAGIPVGHLVMDVSSAALASRNAGRGGVVALVRRLVAVAHSEPEPLQTHTLAIGATSIVEHGSRRTVVTSTSLGTPGRTPVATLIDRNLVLHLPELPMTAISALPGRPLRDLVRLHPALDDRRIETVANRADRIVVTLQRHVVGIRPHTP